MLVKHNYEGYSLLEVLIALCILCGGLLGLAQSQLLALRGNQMAYFQIVAAEQLVAMAERLQACTIVHCDSAGLTNEVNLWNTENAVLLPKGNGFISNGPPEKITIGWQSISSAVQLSLYK